LRQASPPEPLCPSSTKIRLRPSNASNRHANPTTALFFNKFSDFDNLHGVFTVAPQAAVVEIEAAGGNTGSGKFGQVLLA